MIKPTSWTLADLFKAANLVNDIVESAIGGAALLGPEDNERIVSLARGIVQSVKQTNE